MDNIVESSAELSQQIDEIMTKHPLLSQAVEPLGASLHDHQFPIAKLRLSNFRSNFASGLVKSA